MADAFFGHHFLLFHKLFQVIFSSLVFLLISKTVCKFPFFLAMPSAVCFCSLYLWPLHFNDRFSFEKNLKKYKAPNLDWEILILWYYPKKFCMTFNESTTWSLWTWESHSTQSHSIVSHYRLGMCLFTHVQYGPLSLVAKLY